MAVAPIAVLGEVPAASGPHQPFVPHVVAWNLTRRCNLECAHCYIAAGPAAAAAGELPTADILRITDEILALNPAPMFILSGGEPLLRNDLAAIARHAAAGGATVVVGTNGTLLTAPKIAELRDAGVTGFAVSVESLDAGYHDRFRRGHGSLTATLAAVDRLAAARMDFVIQTTVTKGNRAELADLAAWAAERGAVSFNVYFLVSTGRGERMHGLPPEDNEAVLRELVDLHRRYLGRMLVRAKCQPAFMRLVYQEAPESPILNYQTRCPCGIQYCRIGPDGALTACPYLPVKAGDLTRQPFAEAWAGAPLFRELRQGVLGGKCGRCGYRSLCGGCRARAYAEEGDVLAADPACAYEPAGMEAVVRPAAAVTYGAVADRTLRWTAEAEARVARIPSFVRAVVIRRLETWATDHGHAEVTVDMLREVRRAMPIDFSQRLPFFAHDD